MLLHEFVLKAAGESPDKQAVICEGGSLTYGELVDGAAGLSRAMASAGIGKGDRVALLLRNSPQLVSFYYACFQLGAIAVPINIRDKAPEVAYALN